MVFFEVADNWGKKFKMTDAQFQHSVDKLDFLFESEGVFVGVKQKRGGLAIAKCGVNKTFEVVSHSVTIILKLSGFCLGIRLGVYNYLQGTSFICPREWLKHLVRLPIHWFWKK